MMGWGNWGNMMGGYGQGYYGNYGTGNYWWMGLIGMALQVIFWIAVIVIVWRLVSRHSSKSSVGYSNSDNALNILNERFAKGEIDTEEYTRRKESLLH
ncbi:SHOCT domain-containing protein [Desulfitobacterium sp.]|uniref:SHOCT domain-containing protein n=1 Tax=Desulfitobacterium sp. TaxID=49981 RepID=UPI002C3E990E|nr:SHOCT domain-containing protein [Desulfitobacterium sp.]HVJ47696.1 SHOCT domain-containing protein [Desulfitobacterium sp.]